MVRRNRIAPLLLMALALPFHAAAQQAYPARPIRVVLPQAPGAGIDLVVRRMSDDLQPRLGQPLLVENRAGGNSVPGADACAKAAPDGLTLCALNVDALAINSFLFAKLPYDPVKDFRPISSLFTILGGVLVRGSLPVNNIRELQALAVAKPGSLNMGTLGPNTINDLSRQWLADHWKTTLASIPYKGGPPILSALAAGEIDMTYQGVYVALGLAKANKVRVLAVSGTKRLPQFPDAPTLLEIGANDLPSARAWWGVVTQTAVSDAIVRRLNTEIVRLFREPAFMEFLASQVTEGNAGTPEQFSAIITDTREQVGQLFKRYNIEKQ